MVCHESTCTTQLSILEAHDAKCITDGACVPPARKEPMSTSTMSDEGRWWCAAFIYSPHALHNVWTQDGMHDTGMHISQSPHAA